MLKLFLLSSLLLLLGCDAHKQKQVNTKVDAKGGYKDLTLNAPIANIKGISEFVLEQNNECESKKVYVTHQGKYVSIGNIKLDKVELKFVLDSLSGITIFNQLDVYADDIVRAYTDEFGQPSSVESKKLGNSTLETRTWEGDDVRIRFQSSPAFGIIITYSTGKSFNRDYSEEQKCEERKRKKASNDL